MSVRSFLASAMIAALPLNTASAVSTIIAGDQNCAKAAASETDNSSNTMIHYLVSGGWIMGWLSAANRTNRADWLANVRAEHITELIDKYCRGNATVEQAALSVLGQLRMEYAARMEYKRQTGKEAPQE
jgi:hypothetical protein